MAPWLVNLKHGIAVPVISLFTVQSGHMARLACWVACSQFLIILFYPFVHVIEKTKTRRKKIEKSNKKETLFSSTHTILECDSGHKAGHKPLMYLNTSATPRNACQVVVD